MLENLDSSPNIFAVTLNKAKRKKDGGQEISCKLDIDINKIFSDLENNTKEFFEILKTSMKEILDNLDDTLKDAANQGKIKCYKICKNWGLDRNEGGMHWGT